MFTIMQMISADIQVNPGALSAVFLRTRKTGNRNAGQEKKKAHGPVVLYQLVSPYHRNTHTAFKKQTGVRKAIRPTSQPCDAGPARPLGQHPWV